MRANEAFVPVTAPLCGAQRALAVRSVFGQVTAFHVKDDGPEACAAVLASIHRLERRHRGERLRQGARRCLRRRRWQQARATTPALPLARRTAMRAERVA